MSKTKNRKVFGELQEDPNAGRASPKLFSAVSKEKPTIRVVKSNGLGTTLDLTFSTRPSAAADKQSTADKQTSRQKKSLIAENSSLIKSSALNNTVAKIPTSQVTEMDALITTRGDKNEHRS